MLKSALMSYLAYKNPTFLTQVLKNSFYMNILGEYRMGFTDGLRQQINYGCDLILFHDSSSDVRIRRYDSNQSSQRLNQEA